jgi:hypothetical protein
VQDNYFLFQYTQQRSNELIARANLERLAKEAQATAPRPERRAPSLSRRLRGSLGKLAAVRQRLATA